MPLKLAAAVLVMFATALLGVAQASHTGGARMDRVNVSSAGEQANARSLSVSLSADGRYVAFSSLAYNLVADDTNERWDVFVRDRRTGSTERVSVSSIGIEANDDSTGPAVSADGRYVAFWSGASNLVPGDQNQVPDVFLHDRLRGKTERLSVSSAQEEANGGSNRPAISADGRYIAFNSRASNLVPDDANAWGEVFVRDRATGTTERIALDSADNPANSPSGIQAISGDGRFVVFGSNARNLVPGDTNLHINVFIRDRLHGTTERINVGDAGQEPNGSGFATSISADGRYVAFYSKASNLVPTDTNGANDIFVRDLRRQRTERVSVGSGEQEPNGRSQWPLISAHGRYVGFSSKASNLVEDDFNGAGDAFVYDRRTRSTYRVSTGLSGEETNGGSGVQAISHNGRFVALWSDASNLVASDTNGVTDIFIYELWPGKQLHGLSRSPR